MKYKSMTLWHKLPEGSYKRILFDRVLISETKGLRVGGSVVDKDNNLEARIFCITKCPVSVGDRVCIGYESSLTPTPDSYIIKEIKENFSTSANLRHYKVVFV